MHNPIDRFRESVIAANSVVDNEGQFAIVDLPFDDNYREKMGQLSVYEAHNWNYFGTAAGVRSSLSHAFDTYTADASLKRLCADGVATVTEESLATMDEEAVWLTVRGFPANEFTRPRWHTDGRFFTSPNSRVIQRKLAFCLCGDSTNLSRLDAEKRQKLMELQERYFRDITQKGAVQFAINALFSVDDEEHIHTAKQAALFAVGCNSSAVHTEPVTKERRVFVSLVAGTKGEVQLLQNRLGLK